MANSHDDNTTQPQRIIRKPAGLYVGKTADEMMFDAPDRKAINREKSILRAMLLNAEEWDLHQDQCRVRFEYRHMSREAAHAFAIQTLREAGIAIDDSNLRHSGVAAFVIDLPAAAYDTLTAYAAAHPKPVEHPTHVSRTRRGQVKVLQDAADIALYQRAINPKAWVLHGDTAYLNIPIPPMASLENDANVLQAHTLHAEVFMHKSALLLEHYFDMTGVQGIIDHEDGGTIQLRIDASQYREKIEPLAQEKRGASR